MEVKVIQGMRVLTMHVCPVFPLRDFDWSATLFDAPASNSVFGPNTLVGTGSTEERAIDDLFEQYDQLKLESA